MRTYINRSNSAFIARTIMDGIAMLIEAQEKREKEKEASTMQVTYNGFTGELMKLERETGMIGVTDDGKMYSLVSYTLSIYDSEKQVTHSFTGVKLEDVKFLGGVVAFGG